MNFVQKKATTAESNHTIANFAELKRRFLVEVTSTVAMEEIPADLILNWDQTGIKFVPCSSWTMDQAGSRRVEMIGTNDKRQITVVFCGTLMDDFLHLQLIYKGNTLRCHLHFKFPLTYNTLTKALVYGKDDARVYQSHHLSLH